MASPREQPLLPDATDVLRAVIIDGGRSTAFTRAFEKPDIWGRLPVDIARHAARAYARESEIREDAACTRILDMFDAEIARPTDIGSTTLRPGH
jgi:Domain of unknown function (DUF5076)